MFTSGGPNRVYKPRNEISDTETNQVYKPGHTSHKSERGQPVAARGAVFRKNGEANQVYKPR